MIKKQKINNTLLIYSCLFKNILNVNLKNNYNKTALYYAYQNNYVENDSSEIFIFFRKNINFISFKKYSLFISLLKIISLFFKKNKFIV